MARMGDRGGACRVVVGTSDGKRPRGRPRRRWEDDIKMDLKDMGGEVRTGLQWLRIGTGGERL